MRDIHISDDLAKLFIYSLYSEEIFSTVINSLRDTVLGFAEVFGRRDGIVIGLKWLVGCPR